MVEQYWTKVMVTTSPEAVEAVAGILMEAGAGGIEIDDPRIWQEMAGEDHYGELYPTVEPVPLDAPIKVIAYLVGDCRGASEISALKKKISSLKQVGLDPAPALVTTELMVESDWAHGWKEFYHTQRVGDRLVVKPTWESYAPSPEDIVLELDPGMAFGTGEHETTRLCLVQLERWIQPGSLVYDIGTGSGILAVAAAKLGADQVIACDLDAVAVGVARENVARNGLETKIFVEVGTLASISKAGQADLIVANIITDVILKLLPDVRDRLVEGGYFVAGGIIGLRREEVLEALEATGLTVMEEKIENDWVCLVSRK